jgi:hypothetical protein
LRVFVTPAVAWAPARTLTLPSPVTVQTVRPPVPDAAVSSTTYVPARRPVHVWVYVPGYVNVLQAPASVPSG